MYVGETTLKFLVMTDIEGASGVTTFAQAKSDFGKKMLMHDLKAVLAGIHEAGAEAIVYDMHTDGRNVNMEEIDVPVVMGKPILPQLWCGVGGKEIDGLFMIGLHTMQNVNGALLAHSYRHEYEAIYINGLLVGEIGVEAALAGEQGVPLKLVSGDDLGCTEGQQLIPELVTCVVKTSLTAETGICLPPVQTAGMLKAAAREAVGKKIDPFVIKPPYEIKIVFSESVRLAAMKSLHPEIFVDERTVRLKGDKLLEIWSRYLIYEREMVQACR